MQCVYNDVQQVNTDRVRQVKNLILFPVYILDQEEQMYTCIYSILISEHILVLIKNKPNMNSESNNDKTSDFVEASTPTPVTTSSRTKLHIDFRYGSKERRNVDKHIVRAVLQYHGILSHLILDELKSYGFNENHYQMIIGALQGVKEKERSHEKSSKHDYAKLVDIILNNQCFSIIFKHCLLFSIRKMLGDKHPSITEENKRVYVATMEDYIGYIDSRWSQLICQAYQLNLQYPMSLHVCIHICLCVYEQL
eukprot:TRINITY_DN961_c0_g1_i2.p1 TRINITY_DN961_c0_g1~~TRINITY_DN961_c0_g1_i2.p1  ORF type:complete len:270 (+),score=-14.03 TRINITY_DN961_c0_g1_i2:55-810(+)